MTIKLNLNLKLIYKANAAILNFFEEKAQLGSIIITLFPYTIQN